MQRTFPGVMRHSPLLLHCPHPSCGCRPALLCAALLCFVQATCSTCCWAWLWRWMTGGAGGAPAQERGPGCTAHAQWRQAASRVASTGSQTQARGLPLPLLPPRRILCGRVWPAEDADDVQSLMSLVYHVTGGWLGQLQRHSAAAQAPPGAALATASWADAGQSRPRLLCCADACRSWHGMACLAFARLPGSLNGCCGLSHSRVAAAFAQPPPLPRGSPTHPQASG